MPREVYSPADLTVTDSNRVPEIDQAFFDEAAEIVRTSRPGGMENFNPMGCTRVIVKRGTLIEVIDRNTQVLKRVDTGSTNTVDDYINRC